MYDKNQQEEVAEMLIKALEHGTAPWLRPWAPSPFGLRNGVTGHEYRGINIVMLSLHLFEDQRYCSFRQAQEKGWKVKKGSKSARIKYAAKVIKTKADLPEDSEDTETFFINKWFHVFNFEQIEGVPPLEYTAEEKSFDPLPKCEEVLKNMDIELREMKYSDKAFYEPLEDRICLPDRHHFISEIDFYKTAFHEMGHATGAKHRLNREILRCFNRENYAFEELVAEITSFLVGRVLGCGSDPSTNNISYLQSWIEALKNDHSYIFKACRLADQAMHWILYPQERNGLKTQGKQYF
jgi:antirestriction protein ArdC